MIVACLLAAELWESIQQHVLERKSLACLTASLSSAYSLSCAT